LIIEQITLSNFRSYYGEQVIRLSRGLSESKRLVAIGGLNGAGKTSLITAIGLVLLGQSDYFTFLRDKERRGDDRKIIERQLNGLLNREAFSEGVREASITLVIRDKNGKRYGVQRAWQFDSRSTYRGEQLLITPLDGGERLGEDASTAEELQQRFREFLQIHVPAQVAKFFFFDGEEIQSIAKDESESAIVQGIELLLGFHLLDKLAEDLLDLEDGYRTETRRRNRQEEELETMRVEEKKLENRRSELEDEKVELEEKVDKLKAKGRDLAAELRDLLGGEDRNPEALRQELEDVVTAFKEGRKEFERDVDRWITPSLPGDLVQRLASQIEAEDARTQWEEGKRRVEPQRQQLLARVLGPSAPAPEPPLQAIQAQFLSTRIREEWDQLFNPPPAGIAQVVRHQQLSEEERSQARNRCLEILRGGAPDLSRKLAELDSLSRRERELRQLVESMGDGKRASELIAENGKIHRELGEMEARWEEKRRELASVSNDLAQVRQELRKKADALENAGKSEQKAILARNIRLALDEYKQQLRPRKRDEIAEHLTTMYRKLARKEDVVTRIELNEQTFVPRLLDRKGNLIPLNSQSAGEREIYALSLLWALARTSQRELPVVIDTPLARLDSAHRENIVKRYLPEAGRQVIVLSTDTEIDRTNLALVESSIASSYRLDFDPSTERTTVREGYFDFPS